MCYQTVETRALAWLFNMQHDITRRVVVATYILHAEVFVATILPQSTDVLKHLFQGRDLRSRLLLLLFLLSIFSGSVCGALSSGQSMFVSTTVRRLH